jgi:hypothetical protein
MEISSDFDLIIKFKFTTRRQTKNNILILIFLVLSKSNCK